METQGDKAIQPTSWVKQTRHHPRGKDAAGIVTPKQEKIISLCAHPNTSSGIKDWEESLQKSMLSKELPSGSNLEVARKVRDLLDSCLEYESPDMTSKASKDFLWSELKNMVASMPNTKNKLLLQ